MSSMLYTHFENAFQNITFNQKTEFCWQHSQSALLAALQLFPGDSIWETNLHTLILIPTFLFIPMSKKNRQRIFFVILNNQNKENGNEENVSIPDFVFLISTWKSNGQKTDRLAHCCKSAVCTDEGKLFTVVGMLNSFRC